MEDSGLWNKQEDWNAWKTVSVLGCDKKEYCRFFFFFVWLGGSGGRCIMCSILLVALVLCITCLQPWLMDARLPSLPTKAAFVCKRKESMNTTYTSVFWFVHSSQCTTVGIYLFFRPPSLSLSSMILWGKLVWFYGTRSIVSPSGQPCIKVCKPCKRIVTACLTEL